MRTTIRIDDALYRLAKTQAARSGRSVSDLIEDAVREALQPRKRDHQEALPELPVFGGSGLMPGAELANGAALRDLMDEGEDPGALR
ncbi:MAG: ribbon-helix-helix domain-containing protein [Actinomycetota bacterium]|nr:ribbon-helix-helix domain-containing protein [Actinomycetota bacterium]